MRTMKHAWMCVLACGGAPARVEPRFANAPPVTIVDDRRDVLRPPDATHVYESSYGYDVQVTDLVTRQLELPPPARAAGVNALDEVPDSTWFTNRSGLTPAQVRTGPLTADSPELHVPWTINSTKFGGASVGFIVHDARGIKYVLKFDDVGHPEVETGADVVDDRLLWACGYNVPEDQVVYFRKEDLVLAADAITTDDDGKPTGKLTRATVDAAFVHIAREPDGRYRGLASRWLAGKSIGPHPPRGTRDDDPNDLIPHEQRRDLRGMYPVYGWLDAVDVWPGNFLDMWVADPGDASHHYVKHYALDFGASLGVMATKTYDLRRGHTYRLDWTTVFVSLVTAGMVQYDWEKRPRVDIHGVASMFTARGFDPSAWHSDLPYLPFLAMDRYDGLWGAKIVARLSREQIHAAVEAGRYSDPRAVDYITNVLIARQRATAAYWYAKTSPLDAFEVTADRLCFDDLAIVQGYVPGGSTTRYAIAARDRNGNALRPPALIAPPVDGHACVAAPALPADHDGYTIFEITTTRPGFSGSTYVHVARARDGNPRVIGIWRG